MFSQRLRYPVPPNSLSRRQQELQAAGVKLFNLAESNPSRCGLVPDALLDYLKNPAALNYTPDCRGLAPARQALAAINGSSPDDIFLCASTSEAYSWLFKLLCDPGDCILVPKPGYPLFDYLGALEAVQVEAYRMEYLHPGGWYIDLADLEEQLRTLRPRALVLIHPNNPTGSFVRDQERKALEQLSSTYSCALIVDEVFLPFPVEADTAPPSFRHSTEGLVFCLNGLSKMLCLPQFKLGWIECAGAAQLRQEARERLELIADSYLSAGVVPMLALPDLLALAPAHQQKLQRRLRENLSALRTVFDGDDSPYRVLRCDGGWTALLEVPRYLPEEELCLHLLNSASLLLYPGYFFDCNREGILSISLILEEAVFLTAIQKLKIALDDIATAEAI